MNYWYFDIDTSTSRHAGGSRRSLHTDHARTTRWTARQNIPSCGGHAFGASRPHTTPFVRAAGERWPGRDVQRMVDAEARGAHRHRKRVARTHLSHEDVARRGRTPVGKVAKGAEGYEAPPSGGGRAHRRIGAVGEPVRGGSKTLKMHPKRLCSVSMIMTGQAHYDCRNLSNLSCNL